MTPRTDDPNITLAALQIVESIMIDDQAKLKTALAAARAHPFAVMLSLAALASEILQTAPNGPAKLQEWLLATQIETAVPSEETLLESGDGTPEAD